MINKNIEEIKKIISSRRNITNCFAFYNEILDWIENDKADIYLRNDCVFLFYKIHDFYKFYYYVSDFKEIVLSKDLLNEYRKKGTLSLEFTTKNEKNRNKVSYSILPIGFSFYKEYARVISGNSAFKKVEGKDVEEVPYELASLNDKKELLEIMHKEFDIITDYLPSEAELTELINNKSIVIKQLDKQIIFIQIYEYNKGTLYSRMTWIDKKYRKPKYTIDFYRCLDTYLKDLNIQNWRKVRSYGWIDKGNKNYKINLKFGAQPDGVTCTIFLYNMK